MLRPRADPHAMAVARRVSPQLHGGALCPQQGAHAAHRPLQQGLPVALREETGIAYDHGTGGVLQIFRTDEELDGGRRAAQVLESFNVPHRLVDAPEAKRIEPALADDGAAVGRPAYAGGRDRRLPHVHPQARGPVAPARRHLSIRHGQVERLVVNGGRLDAVITDKGPLNADVTVVALGSEAPFLLRPVGIDLPVYPVKGYAVTLPIEKLPTPRRGPRSWTSTAR